ncbi:XRE family transcriptional regulator [Actinomadura sp. KC216]|uniref:helix-turn-helix domain-containing protein n=1 Tax=Actinomadura sp. KC216 TaxID=2530370 RepID=UPI00105297FA|nr:helix-turn-helix transcriptional regulator [Actinomadura sp. KC216]TDB78719.1 XRE family transcriptional regulator [Actinomadura sp. KC216]
MRARTGFDPDNNLWDFIAAELRRHRLERDLSLAAVGDIIDRDRSLVARVESGDTKLQAAHAIKIDKAWDLGFFFRRLVNFAKAGHDVEWFKTHRDLESRASELRIWALGWVPGLFQTEGYIRAMFEAAGVEDAEEGIRSRLKRQECLLRKPRPRVWVILDQGVVEQPVGSDAIMREQIAHLVEMAKLPHVTIRLVPRSAGAHVGRDGSFKIMTVGNSDTVFAAAHGGGRLVQDASEIASYRVWYDLIGDVALPRNESLNVLIKAMERFS